MQDIDVFLTTWSTDRPALQRVRRAVFIEEQQVPEEEEWDDDDLVCVHVLAVRNREPIGTGRLSTAGKIGRLAVMGEFRRMGIGSRMLKLLLDDAAHRGMASVYLHAQVQAMAFYENFGFVAEGAEFDEAGIPHRRMRRSVG
jgi:predicted GNAT family N-acyltransferase